MSMSTVILIGIQESRKVEVEVVEGQLLLIEAIAIRAG
jgi:hypothetical protein